MAESYTLKSGYAYKRPAHGRWIDAEIIVLPQRAEGCSKVFGFITIDDARCVVIQTPVGRFAQTVVAAQDPDHEDTGGRTLPPEGSKSWAPEVIADSSSKWCGNALRFATKEEAEANVANLFLRWTLVRETRVVPSNDLVNYAWDVERGLVAARKES